MRRIKHLILTFGFIFFCAVLLELKAEDFLSSWRNGVAKQAIMNFVHSTVDPESPNFISSEERIAVFDQDGTLWVEQPIYTQVRYCLDRVASLVNEHPEWRNEEPFKTVLTGNPSAIANLSTSDLKKIAAATLTGMSVDQFKKEVKQWIKSARDPRWNKLYTDLTYLPMQEVLHYLRANDYKTYIVTGGGQDFVRVYSQETYGIPPEQVVGTATGVTFEYDQAGRPFLTKDPRLLLNDNYAGKPEGIHLVIGSQPFTAFGNSIGDRQMLEYTKSGKGNRLAMLVLHDDPEREYAYGPANGLPNSNVGTFTQALYDEAKNNGWIIISMKNDWKRVFSWDFTSSVETNERTKDIKPAS
ncbi:MAG: HAD family hydrolase [Chlamydiales bacterium]